MSVHPKYSVLVPPSIQQLRDCEAPVDGRTTMSSESVRQVKRNWADVSSYYTRLVGVAYFAIITPGISGYTLVHSSFLQNLTVTATE
jgi:hypothetical protein